MAFTKTPMSEDERKARKRAASLKHYYAHHEENKAKQNAKRATDLEGVRIKRRLYRAAHLERHREWGRKEQLIRRIKKPWLASLGATRARSKKRGMENTLTETWALDTYTGFCALTGLPFFTRDKAGKPGPMSYSPSIDRIDQSLGYVPGNCRFVLHAVNVMRGSGTDEDMMAIAEALLAKRLPNS